MNTDFARDLRLSGGLTLDELLRSLEEDDYLPTSSTIDINIMPPINENDPSVDTDEDSGNEEEASINNLPGKQLRAEAYLQEAFENEEWDPEDEVPLSSFVKRSKTVPVYKLAKSYQWKKDDLENDLIDISWPQIDWVGNNKSPLELFELFFDQEVIDMFVDCTNNYAAHKNKKADISANELRVFFGILLLSGYHSYPRRRMYWELAKDVHVPIVSEAMSRNRFEHIMSVLHCCDNNSLDANDRFAKVRPLFDKLNKRFIEYAPITPNHSIDEAMVPYFGRHGAKQFLKGKPIRYGYKLWVGATPSGYICWYEPYQGAKTQIKESYKSLGLGASVVLEYADRLQQHLDLPYCFYFDNFFTSLSLLDELTNRKIRAVGTIRKNRIGNCDLKEDKDLQKLRGSCDYRVTENKSLIVIKWSDNNMVHMASNFLTVTPHSNVTRYSQQEKKRISVLQPNAICEYNKFMGGVDRSDQNIGLYRTAIRGKKWYMPLIIHLLDACEQNAWQLHRKQGGKLDQLFFRRDVATSLIEKNRLGRSGIIGKRFGRPSTLENIESRFDRLDHFVVEQDRQTRCRVCHMKVKTKCLKCDIALHVRCFLGYHTKE